MAQVQALDLASVWASALLALTAVKAVQPTAAMLRALVAQASASALQALWVAARAMRLQVPVVPRLQAALA
jgi:hypothetical protein